MYLMIRNVGVADWRGFTTLGVSTTRYAGQTGTIGQFGSGSKLSIALLLRLGIRPVVVTGNLKMEFFSKPEIVQGVTFNRVCVKFSGTDVDGGSKTSTEDLGFTLEWGVQDWTKPHMAFREFVSNAIDGSIVSGKTYKDVEFDIVDKPRAKKGYTSVFIPYTPEIETSYRSLPSMFLHFGEEGLLEKKLLPKQNPDSDKVLIYKKGVLVCHVVGKSVFNYNLGDELTLDESRNAHEWDVKYAVSNALKDASATELAIILKGVINNKDTWEGTLDQNYLYSTYASSDVKEKRNNAFQTAWKAVAGEKGVASSGSLNLANFVEKKGYVPISLPQNWLTVLEGYGVPSETKVLTKNEVSGYVLSEPTKDMIDSVGWVWKLLNDFGLTNGKLMPAVQGFHSVMDAGSQTRGFYEDDIVYLHVDLVAGKLLNKVALEEVVHHVTGATDGSRDIQDFLFRMIVEMAM